MRKILFFIAAALLLLTSCTKKDASSALPRQVDALAVLHMADLYEKAEIDQTLLGQLGDDWRSILENPSETGIDWKSPLYLYMTDNTQGLVASVSSDKKLSQCLMQFGFKVSESDDYTWASNGSYLLGYNNSVLVGNTIYGDEKLFRQRIRKQIEQDEDRSFSATEEYAELMSKNTDVATYFPAGLVMNLLKTSFPAFPDVDFEDVNCLLTLQFDKGLLTSGIQLIGSSPEATEALELLKSSLSPVQGTFVNRVPAGTSVFCTLGTHGQQLLKLIQQHKGIGMLLTLVSQSVPVDELLTSQQGDVAAFMTGENTLFLAQMNDTQLLENEKIWTDGGREYGIRSLGNSQYSLAAEGNSLYFGAQDQNLYLTTSMPLLQETAYNTDIQSLNSQIAGSYGYVWLDVKQILQNQRVPSAYHPNVSWVKQLSVRFTSPEQYELQLVSTDDNVNILKTILQCIRP